MSYRLPRSLVILLLALSAWGLLSFLPLGWGAADAPDGTRFKVSPLGLSHVLMPHQTVSPTVDCRWDRGDPTGPCGTMREATLATIGLRAVAPLVRTSAGVAVLALLTWLAPPPAGRLRWITTAPLPILTLASLALFAWAVPTASRTLRPLPFGTGGTRATLQLALIAALWLGFMTAGRHSRRTPAWWLVAIACGGLALVPFVAMFPLPGALAPATTGLAAGAGLAIWERRTHAP